LTPVEVAIGLIALEDLVGAPEKVPRLAILAQRYASILAL
jgi:hypothetical protein